MTATIRTRTTCSGTTRDGSARPGAFRTPTVGARRHGPGRHDRPARHDVIPNDALRRALLVVLLVAAFGLLGAIATGVGGSPAGFGGAPAVASEATPAVTAARVVARPGDTLWSIAEQHRGDVDQRRYVRRLIELNGGTSIAAGQSVRLP